MHHQDDCDARIITVSPDTTIQAAATAMFSHNIGCLIVSDDNGHLIGLVTERDISRWIASGPAGSNHATVEQIMTKRVVSCAPGVSTSEARDVMTVHGIRHLPIVDRGAVVGILSARDVMSRQLQEDRAAAEEVAMLSTCLKSIDIDEAARTITREVPDIFQARRCLLCLRRRSATPDSFEVVSQSGCPCPRTEFERVGCSDHFPAEWDFCSDHIPDCCRELAAEGPRMVIPLVIGTGDESSSTRVLHGLLCMCSIAAPVACNKELAAYKARLAREILTSHLTNAALYQQARLTSLTDALTGVGSRRLLEDKLEEECTRARRYNRPFSVAMLDLDHFKTINDTLGHAAGDDAIRRLAMCMKAEKRAPDVVARYGGDEFVILLPETTAEQACHLLERLRGEVAEIRLSDEMSLTMSCGVAQSPGDGEDSAREVMRRADVALYQAKSAGRDCVKVWDDSMSKSLGADDIEQVRIQQLQRRLLGLSTKTQRMFMQSIWSLVQALEAKDAFARKHSEHVVHYSVKVAETLGLSCGQVDLIRRAAMIHDIGKIGVPDALLGKPGQLTPKERQIIEQHPLIAVRILSKMSFLEREVEIARSHHEKWNGQGYPDGLPGSAIPLGARIVAVADTFDALTSNRSYHRSRSVAQAADILKDSAGYEFDPDIVHAFVAWINQAAQQLGKAPAQLSAADLLGLDPAPNDESPAATELSAVSTD